MFPCFLACLILLIPIWNLSINWRLFFFYVEYYILKLLFKQNITFGFKKSETVLKRPIFYIPLRWREVLLPGYHEMMGFVCSEHRGATTWDTNWVVSARDHIFKLLDHAGVLYKTSFLSDICVLPLHMHPKYSFVVYFLYALLKKLKEQEWLFDFMFLIRTWEKCNIKFSGSIMEPYSYSNLPNTRP